jgi:hypothetical protein
MKDSLIVEYAIYANLTPYTIEFQPSDKIKDIKKG